MRTTSAGHAVLGRWDSDSRGVACAGHGMSAVDGRSWVLVNSQDSETHVGESECLRHELQRSSQLRLGQPSEMQFTHSSLTIG
jgi:hypothetical protein